MSERRDPIRLVIRPLIAVLCGAALLLIVLILSGSKLDQTSARAIATAAAFALFSLTGVAGASLRDRDPLQALFGLAVVVVSVAAFLALTISIWHDPGDDGWELPGVLVVLALGGGHASLLLRGAAENDTDVIRALRGGVLATIAVLCLLATIEIENNGPDVDPRVFGVLAVLYVLGTILLPLAARSAEPAAATETTAPPAAAGAHPPMPALDLLRTHGHVVVEGPVSRGGAHGSGSNVCLREPDGTLIELISYDRS